MSRSVVPGNPLKQSPDNIRVSPCINRAGHFLKNFCTCYSFSKPHGTFPVVRMVASCLESYHEWGATNFANHNNYSPEMGTKALSVLGPICKKTHLF